MDLLQAPLAIVDLETTGTRPATDRITEIGVLEVERFEVIAQWSTLVNPGMPIPSEIQALTGISRGPEMADLLDERPRFDYDHYRILSRHLSKGAARVVPLDRCTASS